MKKKRSPLQNWWLDKLSSLNFLYAHTLSGKCPEPANLGHVIVSSFLFFCEVRISPNFRKDLHALSPLQMFLFQIASLWTLFLSLLNLRVLIFKWKLVSCSAWTVDYGLNIWYLWSVRCRIVYGWNSWKLNWSLFNRVDFLLGIEIKLKNCI